jgi:hypothetical protein
MFNLSFVLLVVKGRRRCYSCSTLLEPENDCLYNVQNGTEPEPSNIIYCPFYCTIRRQDYMDVHGTKSNLIN